MMVLTGVVWLTTCLCMEEPFLIWRMETYSDPVVSTEEPILAAVPLAPTDVTEDGIRFSVRDSHDQAVVDHALVLLEGHVSIPERPLAMPLTCSALYVRVQYIVTLWPILVPSGHFKALVHLPSPGLHHITLSTSSHHHRRHRLLYHPPLTSINVSTTNQTVSPYRVQFSLQTCPDTDGSVDAPAGVDNSLARALAVLRFNALLLQTFMALLQSAHDLPPHTFAFDALDELGQPIVHNWSTPELTTSKMAAIDDQEIFRIVRRELNETDTRVLHVVVTGCCRYNATTGHAAGHAANGADGSPSLALFGGCGLHAWASGVHDVVDKFTDAMKIPSTLMDDSGHRGTFGGLYATGLGALLHEMGHAFGLGHSPPGTIMSRGGDDLHRVLCLFDTDGSVVRDWGGAAWHPANAIKLHHSPFFRRLSPALALGFDRRENRPSIQWRHDFLGPAGLAYMDGPQRPFKVAIDHGCIRMDLLLDTRDVRIDSDRADDMAFCLEVGEVVVAVTVHAVAWVDGIQLHTTTRSTRVFGRANDVPPTRFDAPSDMYIRALAGTLGSRRIGRLGVFIAPRQEALRKATTSHIIAARKSDMAPASARPQRPSRPIPRHPDNFLTIPSWRWTQLHDVPLYPHEHIVQLDVARDGHGAICGFGLHSLYRELPWQGYRTDALEFFIAPAGCIVESFDVRRDGVDVAYTPILHEASLFRRRMALGLMHEGEVNVHVSSPLGIAAIVLTRKNQGYDLVEHVLLWPSFTISHGKRDGSRHAAPIPKRWFLSYSWWRHVIGTNATPSDYILEVLDVAGTTTRAVCEAMYYEESP